VRRNSLPPFGGAIVGVVHAIAGVVQFAVIYDMTTLNEKLGQQIEMRSVAGSLFNFMRHLPFR
jgi:hypothetical protein